MSNDNAVYVAAEAYAATEMPKFSHFEQLEGERIRLTIMSAYCAGYASAMTHATQIYSSNLKAGS